MLRKLKFYACSPKIFLIKVFYKIFPKHIIIGTQSLQKYFEGKKGIEIGGPTAAFEKKIPIYTLASGMDCCNFSSETVWEGKIKEGENFYYGSRVGYQFLSEASELSKIDDDKYDFIVSAHCLEHIANPIKAVKEWARVIKKGGHMLLILPRKELTFDNKRKVTKFEHLLEDFNNNIDERDLTHLAEILKLHDLYMDIGIENKKNFEERSANNYENRCLHHHVFDINLLKKIFKYLGIKIEYKNTVYSEHIIVGTKL